MSEQAIVDFFTKVSEDVSLQKAVDYIFANNEGAAANQPLADLAVSQGYQITVENLEQLRLAIKARKEGSDELSEEDLESVTGGMMYPNSITQAVEIGITLLKAQAHSW